jgi:GTPase SAR1 family protein
MFFLMGYNIFKLALSVLTLTDGFLGYILVLLFNVYAIKQVVFSTNRIGNKPVEGAVKNFKPIKMVVIGDGGVGKSSLINCYINDQFPEVHVPKVLDCYRTEVQIDNKALTLHIWDSLHIRDSAGQDDYYCSRLRRLGYADADVFLLCYAVSDRDSFKNIE